MNKTLDQLLGLAAQQAHLVLLGLQQPRLVPSWVFVQPDGKSHIMQTDFHTQAQKEATAAYVKAWMRNHQTVAYSFLCEAWVATMTPEEFPADGRLPEADLPRNRVDRIETVCAMASDGQDSAYRQWQIVRDWSGKVAGLAPIDTEGGKLDDQGLFVGLL